MSAAVNRIEPTPERVRKRDLERPEEGVVVTDDQGRALERAIVHRSVDLLRRLLDRSAISLEMHLAAVMFRDTFRKAALDQLHAANWDREVRTVGHAPEAPGHKIEGARRRVGEALDAIGGPASLCGSVTWHVVGLELDLKSWALEHRRNPQLAVGLLVGALEQLVRFYRL
jgi:uncharacterized protein DUF6456